MSWSHSVQCATCRVEQTALQQMGFSNSCPLEGRQSHEEQGWAKGELQGWRKEGGGEESRKGDFFAPQAMWAEYGLPSQQHSGRAGGRDGLAVVCHWVEL